MIPQGTSLTNPAFFSAQIAAVNGAATCDQLTAASADAVASLEAEIATVTSVLAQLSPLVITPGNLSEVITWVTSVISLIVTSQTSYTSQLATLTTNLTALNAAVAARAVALGCP
jgi:hypothetical protein